MSGPTIIRANGHLDSRLLDQSLRDLNRRLRTTEALLTTMPKQTAPLTGSGPITTVAQIKNDLEVRGEHPLNVQSLIGRLAQPQIPFVTTGAVVPALTDPQSQDGALFLLSTTNTIYRFAASPPPGAWVMVAGAATTMPSTLAFNSANISVANAIEQLLTYDSEVYDNDGIHSTSSLTGRLTAVHAGIYVATLNVGFAQNSTGIRFASIRLNGSTAIGAHSARAVNDGASRTYISVSAHYKLAVGDYLDSTAYQDSTAALNIEAFGKQPNFGMALVSSA